jgi:hypothetical protein
MLLLIGDRPPFLSEDIVGSDRDGLVGDMRCVTSTADAGPLPGRRQQRGGIVVVIAVTIRLACPRAPASPHFCGQDRQGGHRIPSCDQIRAEKIGREQSYRGAVAALPSSNVQHVIVVIQDKVLAVGDEVVVGGSADNHGEFVGILDLVQMRAMNPELVPQHGGRGAVGDIPFSS